MLIWICINFNINRRRLLTSIDCSNDTPIVSIVVPAFNEEKVIASAISSLLASSYPNLEIVVVDDGSTDRTAAIAEKIAALDFRVSVLRLETNAGKAHALNAGFAATRSDYVVVVDADTIVDRNFISHIIEPLFFGKAQAVCGNIKVGNTVNIKAAFQSLEYSWANGATKTLQSAFIGITTLPGAGSAFIKQIVLDAGGFAPTTRAEDTELTLKLVQSGFRIVYQPHALAYTEAPTTWISLFRQRHRWIYGNMQCTRQVRLKKIVAAPGLLLFLFHNFLAIPLSLILAISSLLSLFSDSIIPIFELFVASSFVKIAAISLIDSQDTRKFERIICALLMRLIWPTFLIVPYTASIMNIFQRRPVGWHKLERTADAINPVTR